MKIWGVVLVVGLLGPAVAVSKEPSSRSSATFSASNQYGSEAGSLEPTHSVYDTLSIKRPAGSAEYGQGKTLTGSTGPSYSYSGSADSSGGFSNSYSAPAAAPAYRPVVPGGYPDGQSTIRPFTPDAGGYPNKPNSNYLPSQQPNYPQQQQKPEESYAYYYQHYPGQGQAHSHQPSGQYGTAGSTGVASAWQDEGGSDFFGGLGDFGPVGAGIAGVKGLKALGAVGLGLAALAKGFLAIKPLLVIGFLLLITLPLLILFLPVPIITLQPSAPAGRTQQLTPAQAIRLAVTSLSEKVLNAEECLERIACKLPSAVPEKYQSSAKSLWTEYGLKYVQPGRLQRGLAAYFDSPETKHRAFKCNQKFKCTNKFF